MAGLRAAATRHPREASAVRLRSSSFIKLWEGSLLYPTHFAGGALEWPRLSKKPNALMDEPETKKWLYRNGFYTVVRRFSSKEERRRIVAHVVDPAVLKTKAIGFENHLNVFHAEKRGIDGDVARGLSVFLNSTAIDEYFRRFSGHTQVNATDPRLLRYPELKELKQLGRWWQRAGTLTQEQIDEQVAALHARRKQDRRCHAGSRGTWDAAGTAKRKVCTLPVGAAQSDEREVLGRCGKPACRDHADDGICP